MLEFLKLGLLKKGVMTKEYPYEKFEPYKGSMGLPVVDMGICDMCNKCVDVCPTSAIATGPDSIEISLQRCIFCAACADACTSFSMSTQFELSSKNEDDLKVVYRHGC